MSSDPFLEQPDILAAAAFERAALEGLPPATPRRSVWRNLLSRCAKSSQVQTEAPKRAPSWVDAARAALADLRASHSGGVIRRDRPANDLA
jgi:hypothetical protein